MVLETLECHFPTTEVFKLQQALDSPRGLINKKKKMIVRLYSQSFWSGRSAQCPKICISNKLLGDFDAVGPNLYFENHYSRIL